MVVVGGCGEGICLQRFCGSSIVRQGRLRQRLQKQLYPRKNFRDICVAFPGVLVESMYEIGGQFFAAPSHSFPPLKKINCFYLHAAAAGIIPTFSVISCIFSLIFIQRFSRLNVVDLDGLCALHHLSQSRRAADSNQIREIEGKEEKNESLHTANFPLRPLQSYFFPFSRTFDNDSFFFFSSGDNFGLGVRAKIKRFLMSRRGVFASVCTNNARS